jgi:hypothetical protein
MSNLSDLIDAIEKSHSDAVNLTGDILWNARGCFRRSRFCAAYR